MAFEPSGVFAVVILLAAFSIATRIVIGTWTRRHEGGPSASGRLAIMEERIQKIEEATSGLIAEFAAVRERERFMTQLVESRARRDAQPVIDASLPAKSGEDASPFVVQTVSAVRRTR